MIPIDAGGLANLDPRLQLGLLAAGVIMNFVRRHHAQTGALPSDAEVEAELQRDLREGRGAIHDWFLKQGLTPPAD